jgi:hypothetical protein
VLIRKKWHLLKGHLLRSVFGAGAGAAAAAADLCSDPIADIQTHCANNSLKTVKTCHVDAINAEQR